MDHLISDMRFRGSAERHGLLGTQDAAPTASTDRPELMAEALALIQAAADRLRTATEVVPSCWTGLRLS